MEDSRNSQDIYSSLTQEQEANILQLLEEYENALDEREFEEVKVCKLGQHAPPADDQGKRKADKSEWIQS